MNDEQLLMLVEGLGEDAKGAFMFYIGVKYLNEIIWLGMMSWGVRTLWKNRDWFKG